MFVSESLLGMNREMVVETREVSGVRPLVAFAVAEVSCRHDRPNGRRDLCLLNPPAFTWFVGFGWRASLGTLLWKVGCWADGYQYQLPLVNERMITTEEAVDVWGWDKDQIENFFSDDE